MLAWTQNILQMCLDLKKRNCATVREHRMTIPSKKNPHIHKSGLPRSAVFCWETNTAVHKQSRRFLKGIEKTSWNRWSQSQQGDLLCCTSSLQTMESLFRMWGLRAALAAVITGWWRMEFRILSGGSNANWRIPSPGPQESSLEPLQGTSWIIPRDKTLERREVQEYLLILRHHNLQVWKLSQLLFPWLGGQTKVAKDLHYWTRSSWLSSGSKRKHTRLK